MNYYEIFRYKDVERGWGYGEHEDYHASETDDVDEALREWAEENERDVIDHNGRRSIPMDFAAKRTSPEEMMEDDVRLAEQKIRDLQQQIENVHETLEAAQEVEIEAEAERDLFDPCPECGGVVDYEYQKHGLEISDFYHSIEAYACIECGWIDEENSSVG